MDHLDKNQERESKFSREEYIEKVSKLLELLSKYLRTRTFSKDLYLLQAQRIVDRKIRLGPFIDNEPREFRDRKAKLLYYLRDICTRLPERDMVLFTICNQIADHLEREIDERVSLVNLRDKRVIMFLKLIINAFHAQSRIKRNELLPLLGSAASSNTVNKVKESRKQLNKYSRSLLESVLGNLVDWTNKVTDYTNGSTRKQNSDHIKKK